VVRKDGLGDDGKGCGWEKGAERSGMKAGGEFMTTGANRVRFRVSGRGLRLFTIEGMMNGEECSDRNNRRSGN
jgi:hypothetical protein